MSFSQLANPTMVMNIVIEANSGHLLPCGTKYVPSAWLAFAALALAMVVFR